MSLATGGLSGEASLPVFAKLWLPVWEEGAGRAERVPGAGSVNAYRPRGTQASFTPSPHRADEQMGARSLPPSGHWQGRASCQNPLASHHCSLLRSPRSSENYPVDEHLLLLTRGQ